MAKMFQIGCDNGHKTNTLIPDDLTIKEFLNNNKCEKCGAAMHHRGFPDES